MKKYKNVELYDKPFEVYLTDSYKGRKALEACSIYIARFLSQVYDEPSQKKQQIFEEWEEWCYYNRFKDFCICSYSKYSVCFSFRHKYATFYITPARNVVIVDKFEDLEKL